MSCGFESSAWEPQNYEIKCRVEKANTETGNKLNQNSDKKFFEPHEPIWIINFFSAVSPVRLLLTSDKGIVQWL